MAALRAFAPGFLGCVEATTGLGRIRRLCPQASKVSNSTPASPSTSSRSLQGQQARSFAGQFLPSTRHGGPSWVEAAGTKPVSQDTLAGIPWAGRSTLTGLFLRVASNGPKDPAVWRRLTARADVIAHSLTPKQASLMLSAMARAQQRQDNFLRRFSVKFIPSLIESAELMDLCGIVSSLSQLGANCEESFSLAAQRLSEVANQLDARQLSLVVNAYVRSGHYDKELFDRLLKQVPRRLARCTGKDAAVLLNAMSQLPALGLKEDDTEKALTPALEAVALRLPELLPTADLHSLTLILNAFAQLQFVQKDILDLLTEELLANPEDRLQRLSPRQLAMVLNGTAKLQLLEPRLLEILAAQVRQTAQALDAQSLCVIANACAKLQMGLPTFQILYAQIPRLLARLSGRQLAMICHAWAKAHIHNDDLFSLLALPLAQRASSLSAHEVAIAIYGYAHFRKSPMELFNPLLERFTARLEDGVVSDGDLLMIGNALGRIGRQDERIEKALGSYLRREPDTRHLSPQTVATFQLADLIAEVQEGTSAT